MLVGFEPPPGITSDDTTFALPGTWADASNVRFRMGRAETIGGWADALGGDTLSGVCRNAYAWVNGNGLTQIAFGTHASLHVYSGDLFDITPSGLVSGSIDSTSGGAGWGSGAWNEGTWSNPASVWYARTWSLDAYGEWLIANPRGGTIYKWEGNTANDATAVTNAPAVVTCCLVTPERQIIAFGCSEEVSGDYNSMCIRWSDIEDITDWTTAGDSNAGEYILEGGGRIVGARLVGSYIFVWTDSTLFRGEFIGAADQTFRFDRVDGNSGLAGPNAVAVFEQGAMWLGSDFKFRYCPVGGAPQVVHCPILADFRDNLVTGQIDKVVGCTVTQHGEAWFFYPDARDGSEASRYVAYAFRESSQFQRPVWFRGILARTQAFDAGATAYPVMSAYDGSAYLHEYGRTGKGLEWFAQTSDTYIEEGGRDVMIRRFVPDFEEQDGTVNLALYTKKYPMSAAVAKGPYPVLVTTEKKDFRASGRLVAIKLSSDAWARIGRPVLDVVPTGSR